MPIHRTPEAPPERVKIDRRIIPTARLTVPPPFNPKPVEPKSYYHSGAIGDVLYALYAIKKDGGGKIILGPEQHKTAAPGKPISEEQYQSLKPLLDKQPYLVGNSFAYQYRGRLNVDLNQFRNHWFNIGLRNETGINLLAEMHCYVLGLHHLFDHTEQWIFPTRPIKTNKYVVNRSQRYRNAGFKWPGIVDQFGAQNLMFVGLDQEHKEFCQSCGQEVEHVKVDDFLHMANLIAGSLGFIGNQSAPCALAIGLGQRVIQEACQVSPDCVLLRKNLIAYLSGGFLSPSAIDEWRTSKLEPLVEPQVISDIQHPPVISIVVFNRLDLTKRCLEMIYRNTPAFTVVVTDNASSDGTAEYLDDFEASHENMQVIHNRENRGYKDPNNLVFDSLGDMEHPPKYFAVLNNDLEIGRGWWHRIEATFAKDPKLAIVGSSTGVCGKLDTQFHGGPVPKGESPDYVEGSLMAVRVDIVSKLGLFDQNLEFMYGEDSDLSLRVREAGYRVATADLNCRHLVTQTLRTVDEPLRRKIRHIQEVNHTYLRKRWGTYIKRRNFNYTVLVNRRAAIGDVIDVTAVVAQIKKSWPDSWISIQTDLPEAFTNNPDIRFAGRSVAGDFDYRYDLDLSYERRPELHTIEAYAEVCGLKPDLKNAKPHIYPSVKDDNEATRLIDGQDESKLVAIHAVQSWPGKTWPRENWIQMISDLVANGYIPVLVGSEKHWDLGRFGLDIRGQTSVQILCSILKRCKLFIGIDSAPSHVAQAAGCPSVVLFGTVWSHLKLFPACKAVGVQANIEQNPCVGEHHRILPPITHSECDGACMRAITVDMVKSAIQSVA